MMVAKEKRPTPVRGVGRYSNKPVLLEGYHLHVLVQETVVVAVEDPGCVVNVTV
jgi:hypothetical protein